MNLTEHILTGSDCWKTGRTITPKGVMIHSTGVAQPDPEVFLKSWNRPGVEACAHAFVHKDGVIQTLPWNWRGWHAGAPRGGGVSANNTHISLEILEPAGHTYQGGVMIGYDADKNAAYFAAVYRNAVEQAAMLCTRYGLDPLKPGVVVDHAEGCALGIASNHADVGHWFPRHGKNMDQFRADVAREMKGGQEEMTQETFNQMFRAAMEDWQAEQAAQPVSAWAEEARKAAKTRGLFDGTAPRTALTREQAALVLERMERQK